MRELGLSPERDIVAVTKEPERRGAHLALHGSVSGSKVLYITEPRNNFAVVNDISVAALLPITRARGGGARLDTATLRPLGAPRGIW